MTIFKYMNPKNLQKEIWRYGYHFSLKKSFGYLALVYFGIAGLSYLFSLKLQYTLIIMGVITLFYPSIILMTFRSMYEQKKFEDITAYMEQILYSFKRRGKILIALEDARTLFYDEEAKKQCELYYAINKAIEYIHTGNAQENIYREAFAIIEEEYGCKRLYKIHDYLIQVEAAGGSFDESIDTLLSDRQLWMDRIYSTLKEKQNIKVKTTIGVMLSLGIVYSGVLMMPKEFGINQNIISQVMTTFAILCDFFIWYFVQRSLSKSPMDDDTEVSFEDLKRSYDYVMTDKMKAEGKKFRSVSLVLLPLAIVLYSKFSLFVAVGYIVFCIIIFTQPSRHFRHAIKKIKREVEKQFPEWLLGLTLHLQSNNVHVAITKSIDTAPQILRAELINLESGIEAAPNSVQPYINFMKKLDLPDITSAMKMLYSMATFGFNNQNRQIQGLIDRNAKMMDKAERIKQEDYLAGIGFFVLLPMITGVMKLLTDLMLVIFYMLSMVQKV